jgi:hypothetical protein
VNFQSTHTKQKQKFPSQNLIKSWDVTVDEPNIFCFPSGGASPFWKGVIWAAKAACMGFQW